MKIAVLLRGQLRYSKEGAHLFEKFVMDKFPQHQFDFFVSTPKRINFINDKLPQMFVNKNLSPEEAKKEVDHWCNVRLMYFQSEYELFDISKQIVQDNTTDKELYKWVNSQTDIKNVEDDFWLITPPLTNHPEGDYKVGFEYNPAELFYNAVSPHNNMFDMTDNMQDVLDLLDKIAANSKVYHNISLKDYTITLHNLIAQYYSFAKSFKVLKDYMKSNPDYVPDLVWSTRFDIFHTFDGQGVTSKFDELLYQLNFLYDSVDMIDKKAILSNVVVVNKNNSYVCDFNFFSTVEMLDNILDLDNRTCGDIILDAMTKDKINFMTIKNSTLFKQHALWSAVFNNACFYPTRITSTHFSSVIRPNFDADAILKMTGSDDDEKLLKKMDSEFKYPVHKTIISPGKIIEEFEYLSTN